jgi:hypothetical protein
MRIHQGCRDEAEGEGPKANTAKDDASHQASFLREPFPGANDRCVVAQANSSIVEHTEVESKLGEVAGLGKQEGA